MAFLLRGLPETHGEAMILKGYTGAHTHRQKLISQSPNLHARRNLQISRPTVISFPSENIAMNACVEWWNSQRVPSLGTTHVQLRPYVYETCRHNQGTSTPLHSSRSTRGAPRLASLKIKRNTRESNTILAHAAAYSPGDAHHTNSAAANPHAFASSA